MKAKYILSIVFILLILTKGIGQEFGSITTKEANFGIVLGYSGFKNNMIEVGIGFQPWEVEGSAVMFPFAGFLALYEFDPSRKLYGTSFNAWYLAGPFSCGLNLNRYSDFTNETYGIKPMIGISIVGIGIMYGRNFFVTPNSIDNLGKRSLTVKYYLPLWHKKDVDEFSN